MTRQDLLAQGYIAMHAAADLHEFGWQVRYWFRPSDRAFAIEYSPRRAGGTGCAAKKGEAGAVIVRTYAEQVEFHRKIGAAVVPPGEEWRKEYRAGDVGQERRRGWAGSVEDMEERFGGGTHGLDMIAVKALERLARRCLPAGDVGRLAEYIYRVYPCEDYWRSAWLNVLSGQWRAPLSYRWVDDPGSAAGRKFVPDEALPREGWTSPFPNGWRDGQLWQRCSACKRWHGPGQLECIGAAMVDGVQLDADAERVLGSIRPAA
jgi:hypothetical protein